MIGVELGRLAINPNYLFEHNAVVRSLASLVIVGLALWYFFLLITTDLYHVRGLEFWACVGLMLYFSINFVLFLLSEVVVEKFTNELAMQVFVVHSIANIGRYLLFAVGAWNWEKSSALPKA